MKLTTMIFSTAFAAAVCAQAQAAVDAGATTGTRDTPSVTAAPQTAGFWGICGPGRLYRHAEFIEIYSGGVLQGAIYTVAGCYTPA